jgi:hypothetical protein
MIETRKNRVRTADARRPGDMPDPTKGMIFQIIQASANDNLMPATKWFTWLISWTIIVGAALAYAIF